MANASRAVWANLYASCGPSRIERYRNNERIRREISPNLVDRMAFGTTGPEALNSESARWFSGVSQMGSSVLRLKMRVFHLCNMSAFYTAMYNKPIAHVRKPLVLSRR